jgi:hypothetical protein
MDKKDMTIVPNAPKKHTEDAMHNVKNDSSAIWFTKIAIPIPIIIAKTIRTKGASCQNVRIQKLINCQ